MSRIREKIMPTMERLTKFCDYPMLILMVFTATYFIYRDFGVGMSYGYGIVGLLIIICAVRRFSTDPRKWKGTLLELFDPFRFAAFFIVLIMVLSFLRPDSTHNKSMFIYTLTICACVGFVVLADVRKKEASYVLRLSLLFSLLLAAFILFFNWNRDLYQAVIYPLLSKEAKGYVSLTLGTNYGVSVNGVTYTSYALALGLSVICGYLLCIRKRWNRQWNLLCAAGVLLIVALIAVGRRGELLSAAFALFVFFLITLLTGKGKKKWVYLGGAAGAVVLALVLFILFLPLLRNVSFLQRYIRVIDELLAGKDFTSGRVVLWKYGWDLYLRYPIFGAGLDRYADFIPEAWRLTSANTVVKGPHIVYLQFLCELGTVGAILLTTPIVYCFVQTARQYLRLHQMRMHKVQRGQTLSQKEMLMIQMNAASLVLQLFFCALFWIDQTYSLAAFWLFYAIALYLSSTALRYEQYAFDDRFTNLVRSTAKKAAEKVTDKIAQIREKRSA